MTALQLTGLTRRFPGATSPTLDGVDLEVPAGGCVALLGPSGTGKSTVLRLIAGLDTPDAGEIMIGDRPLAGVPPERRRAAMVFQRPRLFPQLSVLDNVAFPLVVAGVRKRSARADAVRFLELVGAGELRRRRPHTLSGGQEQRVALARALAARPDVLLLDEPFGALDPAIRSQMHELLGELRAAVESTILLVTHDRQEASAVADTIAVLWGGRIAQHDRTVDLYARPASMAVHHFLGGRNAIPGSVVEGMHHSGMGALALPTGSIPDGPGVLVIRHEAVRLTAPDDAAADAVGTVGEIAPAGARSAIRVDCGDLALWAAVSPDEQVQTGQQYGVVLPLRQRHVVPPAQDEPDRELSGDRP